MRAVRTHDLQGPKTLRVDEIDPPRASAGEIVVRVHAAGVNFPDILITQGKYQFKPEPPFSPGGEIAGVVSAVGAGVTDFSVGDRVAATMTYGAFAEEVAIDARAAAPLPAGVSFEVGAATLLTYATTMHALVDRAAIAPGETLLVLGAAGGVGTAAIELGKVLGAKVIAAASSAEKLAYCREKGADLTVDYVREDLKERLKALTNGNGVDVTYDPVGGDFTEAAFRAMAWGGRHLVVGFAAGPIPKLPANLTLLKGAALVGVFWGSFAVREHAKNRAHIARVLRWIEEGKVKPHVDATFPLERAGEALERLADRKVRGKVVLTTS